MPRDALSLTTDERRLVVATLRGEAEVYDWNGEAADAARLRSAARKLDVAS